MFSARITSPKKYEITDIDIPVIDDGMCLIQLEQWSVCGSDIRHTYGPVHPEEEYPMRHGGACHECAGTIVESKSDKFKVMLLVSDGEDHDGQALELAAKAANAGLIINTVGVGSKAGSLIPEKSKDKKNTEYKRDRGGKLITSTLNETILKEIAAAGNGSFFWFGNTKNTYKEIVGAIANMEKKTISTHEFSEYEDRYQSFALVAFCFLVMGFIMPTRPKVRP